MRARRKRELGEKIIEKDAERKKRRRRRWGGKERWTKMRTR